MHKTAEQASKGMRKNYHAVDIIRVVCAVLVMCVHVLTYALFRHVHSAVIPGI